MTVDINELRDAERCYGHLVLHQFPRDMRVGLTLAFYRTFAVPRIAELLASTGHMQRHPHKRSLDTGLFMYELIAGGYDSVRGRQVVTALNRIHHRWDILNEDYRYVLLTFIVVPTRWLATYGPRPLTSVEAAATTRFYLELGRRMHITDLPDTYTQAEEIFDRYEDANIASSPAGRDLMAATTSVMADQLPRGFVCCAPLLTRLVIDDYIAGAVGLQPAPPIGRLLMRLVGASRRRLPHHRADSSWFVPGENGTGMYPGGYRIEDLGPREL